MSDTESLLLVIAALYLYECMAWVRRDAVPLRTFFGSRWRVVNPDYLFGNAHGGLMLRNPLPPLGRCVLSQAWPVSFSPTGVFSFVATAFNPGKRAEQVGRFVRYDEIRAAAATGRTVYVNGAALVTAGSERMAHATFVLIQRLRGVAESDRAAVIEEALAGSLDFERAATRVRECREQTRVLSVWCNALFLYVFAALPLVIQQYGLAGPWPWLAAGLVILVAATAIEYAGAHRALYPGEPAGRRGAIALMVLTPLSAIRAVDALWKELLATQHPLAAARALCREEDFARVAGAVWRDALHGIPFTASSNAEAEATRAWFHERARERMARSLGAAGIEASALERAPALDDPSNRSFCPRCHSQFVIVEGMCESCGGLGLRRFDAEPIRHLPVGEKEECTT